MGRLEAVRYYADGKPRPIAPILFHVYVKDCQWQVCVEPVQQKSPSEYFVISFDGRDQYTLGKRTEGDSTSWGGSVSPEKVPFFGPTPTAPVVWLAFASSCFVEKSGGVLIPPYSIDVLRTQLVIHVNHNAQMAPHTDQIVFMDDGFDRSGETAKPRKPPFDTGFTNAVYSVFATTNLGNFEIPIHFSLAVYRPVMGGMSGKKTELEFQYSGYVSNASAACSLSSFVPNIPSPTMGRVRDTRFALSEARYQKPFAYETTNWLSVDEVEKLPAFTAYKSSLPSLRDYVPVSTIRGKQSVQEVLAIANDSKGSGHRSRIILVVLVGTLLIPPIILFRSQRQKKP
jgi:hypothetical protein